MAEQILELHSSDANEGSVIFGNRSGDPFRRLAMRHSEWRTMGRPVDIVVSITAHAS